MKFEWIIPVVVLIVWLLNKLLRGQENDEAVKPARGAATRSPSSDIDRFLNEIEQMRRSKADGRTIDVPVVRPVPIERPRPVPRPRAPQRQSKPVDAPQVVPVLESYSPSPNVLPPEAEKPFTAALGRKASPSATALAVMLKTPQSLRAAVLLQEILAKPKARR